MARLRLSLAALSATAGYLSAQAALAPAGEARKWVVLAGVVAVGLLAAGLEEGRPALLGAAVAILGVPAAVVAGLLPGLVWAAPLSALALFAIAELAFRSLEMAAADLPPLPPRDRRLRLGLIALSALALSYAALAVLPLLSRNPLALALGLVAAVALVSLPWLGMRRSAS